MITPLTHSLKEHYDSNKEALNLKQLLLDPTRTESFKILENGVYYDYSKENLDTICLEHFGKIIRERKVLEQIASLSNGVIRELLRKKLTSPRRSRPFTRCSGNLRAQSSYWTAWTL